MSPIYEKPVRLLMRDMATAFELGTGETFTRQRAVEWFSEHYPLVKKGTVTAHLVRLSINVPSRLNHNIKPGEDDLFFQVNRHEYCLYDTKAHPRPIHDSSYLDSPESSQGSSSAVDDEPQETSEFVYESHLRDYLAKNLHTLEPGLSLYSEDDINGVEFPAGGRFIDILAVTSDGDYVVIELKVARAYDRVVGQIARYMAWVRSNLASTDQSVRGVIVASHISEDLILACSEVPNVSLREYQLSIELSQVSSD